MNYKKNGNKKSDYAIMFIIALMTVVVALTIVRITDINSCEVNAGYSSCVAPDSIRFAMQYHGIIYTDINAEGEYIFYRNNQECILFTQDVRKAWKERKDYYGGGK